jgi:cell pole-organizing protein PopZ
MMAQPNVVREPSMDEILASIRRIIESNDPVPPGGPTSMPEPEGFSGDAANDDMEDVPLTIDEAFPPRVEAVRSPIHEAPPADTRDETFHTTSVATDAAPQPQRSLSLADVAARVRAASERNPGLRELAPKPEEEVASPATSPLITGRMAIAGTGRPVELAQAAQDMVSHAPAESQQAALPELTDVTPAEPLPEYEPAAPVSLISSDAGQQVARSFQDLAVAIDHAERRSHDEIATELLRPMLQEWLDENLPTLVERLVREEIERVARGNRR